MPSTGKVYLHVSTHWEKEALMAWACTTEGREIAFYPIQQYSRQKKGCGIAINATVTVITLALVSAPRYQKLKRPFRVGPCARDLARETPCQQTGWPICSLTQGGFGGHFIVEWFHNTAFAEAACPVLMLYRRGLPSPVLTQGAQAYTDVLGTALPVQSHTEKASLQKQKVPESLKCLHQEFPILADCPFFQFLTGTELEGTVIKP